MTVYNYYNDGSRKLALQMFHNIMCHYKWNKWRKCMMWCSLINNNLLSLEKKLCYNNEEE